MFRIMLSSLVVAALAVTALLASAQAAPRRLLRGEVGPGFSIEVTRAGKDVKRLKAGVYRIKIEDKAAIHNFHLIGPRVNRKTTVPFMGDRTWTVRLRPGRYT